MINKFKFLILLAAILLVATNSYAAFTEKKRVYRDNLEYQAQMVQLLTELRDEMKINNQLQSEMNQLYKQSVNQLNYKQEN